MKLKLVVILFPVIFFSCDFNMSEELEPDCIIQQELYPSDGYEINELGEIDSDQKFENFQFVNDSIGYALFRGPNKFAKCFNTDDGGRNWTTRNEGFEEFPYDLSFVNENNGIISVQSGLDECEIYITDDGGYSWSRKLIDNLSGPMTNLAVNDNGTIVGFLNARNGVICKSEDNGNIWEVIFESDEYDIQTSSTYLKADDDFVYFGSREGELFQINFQGEIVSRIDTHQSWIQDALFLSDDIIIVSYLDKLIKTENGGASWFTILTRNNKIIDFKSFDEGIVLSGALHCTVLSDAGLFITTSTGGSQWNEHNKLTESLFSVFNGSYNSDSDSYYFFMNNKQYELKKQ